MDREFTFGERKFVINNLRILLNGNFVMTPNEIGKITSLVSTAGSMASMPRLPAKIEDPPFTILFMEDGNHHIERNNGDFITFKFEEVDELITHLQMARQVATDMQKIVPQTIPTYRGPETGDVFEGRD